MANHIQCISNIPKIVINMTNSVLGIYVNEL